MKVISSPDLNDWRERATCRHCTTEVEVEASDLRHYVQPGDRPSEGSADMFAWTCPTCGRTSNIKPPAHVEAILIVRAPVETSWFR